LEAAHLACAQKKAQREGRTIVFIDESGLSERPSVARTWSRRGHTPVLQHSFNWKQLSAIAGLSFWQFYFRFFPGAIRSEQIIAFVAALKRQIKRPLLIIWDGVATHRSRKVKAWLEDQDGTVAVARLPAYAPELNPVRRSGLTSRSMRSPTCAATPSVRSASSHVTASNPCSVAPTSSPPFGNRLNWPFDVIYLYGTQ
jgi:transposase